ncbi:MAG: hypothetical protein A2849_02760 [Candidatus Taylorbacteria bacterium RIFCSPHIGHO2_01_FULL_51_15]|uniref:MSP domain-containing protein n=1 Tax=Candidatus Taylorbacteria bacterium RIFCSPHIGHO2_01_FULL_51_15 TaxID=1802304 RepID=A0A1G2MD74_9BACT|nr:MAG: hypothetical protein A2849_02760 [Candidatus Taylorbacteria bacterium RIFCSPHIGHO2_01_FULL_51_15]
MKNLTTITQICLFLLLFPILALAIGVSVTPPTLSIRMTRDEEGTARFLVSNPSKEVGIFDVYPEEFEKFITLYPSRFVLEAGEKREVLVRAKRRDVGLIRTAIAIEAAPLGVPTPSVGGGIRLPFSLDVRASSAFLAALFESKPTSVLPTLILTALILTSVISLYTLKRVRRKDTL